MTLRLPRWRPLGVAAQFALLLVVALVGTNLIAVNLIAREGSDFDRQVRLQRDMGRLSGLVSTLEETDRETGLLVLERTGTGYTRFSIDEEPIALINAPRLSAMEAEISATLPDHEVYVSEPVAGRDPRQQLMLISVKLDKGAHSGRWLNSLVYPLTATDAWWQKSGFFIPLAASLVAALAVGLVVILRITRPLTELAMAARAAGRGDRSARVQETGAREMREAAVAFNDMQQRIADFDATRRKLLAAIGHDLRTPITGLRLRTELLDDAEVRAPMIRILQDMTVMTDDLLRFARAIGQAEPPSRQPLDVLVRRVATEAGIPLHRTEPLAATIRPVALARAIGNLVSNAQRYADGGGISLERRGGLAVISVTDRGPGIPADQLPMVMEPFVRGDDSRSSDTGGAGLGLAIARTIAQDHGGDLVLSNRREGGLRAELHLPLGTGRIN